jgi:hypothetical protein
MIKSTRRNRRSAFTGFLCNNAMVGVQSSVLTNVSAGGSRSAHVLRMQPETLLLEDRVMPVVNLSVKNVAVVEGDVQTAPSYAKFTVTRDGDTSQPFTFKYKTEAGTAKPGIDYIQSEGTQTIKAGDSSTEVEILIVGNNKYQSDRKFSLAVWDENQTTGQDITFGDVYNWQNTKVNWTDQMAFGDLNGDGNDEIIVQQMWAIDGFTAGISDLGQLSIYDTQSKTPEFPIDVMLNLNSSSLLVKVNSLQVVNLDKSVKAEGGVDYADIVIGTSDSVVIFRGKQSLT